MVTPPKSKSPDTSLLINDKGELAFFYVGKLNFEPEWATIDVDMKEICVGGDGGEIGGMRLEKVGKNVYEHIHKLDKIMLVGVDDTPERKPIEGGWVPLTVATQTK